MSTFREAQVWEDGLRTDPNKKSFEWWYFDANFDDGSTFVITFFTKQAQNSSGPLNPSVNIVYTTPNGEKNSFSKDYSPKEFKASTEICDVLMGPNKVSGDLKKYKMHFDIDGIKGDLEFNRVAPSYSTTENRDEKPADFGWFPSIPYGTVSGKIEFNGENLNVNGSGYHDHNWGTVDMKDFCDYWYWGRGNVNGYYTIFSVMYLRKILLHKPTSILYLATKDKILVGDSEHLQMVKTDINPPTPTANRLPGFLTFSYNNNGESVEFSLTEPKMIESADPMSGEKGLRGFLIHLFSKPRYVRYNAKLSMDINLKDIKDKKDGTGLYEIMILR